MIHYALRCSRDHAFDGWFANSTGFDAQVKRGLVECPTCGDRAVERGLMAPALSRKGNAAVSKTPDPIPQPSPPAMAVVPDRLPAHIRAGLQKMRAEVERNCDYVGTDFAAEARRIHDGESAPRGIYGESTVEQAEALAEDGIAVSRIPWVPRADG